MTESAIRHIVLNALRQPVKHFRPKYGEVVVCCDNKKYWRKEFFPYYKNNRKKMRDKSPLDWTLIFDTLSLIREEIKGNLPYKLLDVHNAEADDIIGTLAPRHSAHEKVLIVSDDGDFLQLQKYKNVEQYSPTKKKFLVSVLPEEELIEKIIKGDAGDGIPNILSPDNCLAEGIRQKTLTQGRLLECIEHSKNIELAADEIKRNWYRNQNLIDLTYIPINIKNEIIEQYENTETASRSNLLNYFIEHRLKNLLSNIEDF